METSLWSQYPPGEINEKIEYWVDVWDDLIDYFTKTNYGLELSNPHVALLVLIDEIENNELRNGDIKTYLLEAIGKYLKDDPVISSSLATEFGLLLKSFQSNSQSYLAQSARSMFPFFVNGEYFRKTCDSLFKVIQDSTWNKGDEDKIRSMSGSLIVELILKGYGLKSIREFPRNIFKAESDKSSIFPKSLYPEEDTVTVFDSLSVADRLGSFARHYFKKPLDYIVIFEIEGLKGDAELEIGGVTFYSPYVRSFFAVTEDEATKSYKEQELFGKKDGSSYFANCAVKLSFVDSEIGVIRAAEMAEKSLDLLICLYRSNCKFTVLRNQHLVLRGDGTWQSLSHGVGDNCGPIKHLNSIEIKYLLEDDKNIENLNNLAKAFLRPKENQSPIERKVYDCVHWLRKGEEAERMEDKLLHYWIAIEKIFTFPSTSRVILHDPKKEESKIFLIRELLSSCIAYNFIYHVGWTLRDYLMRLLGHPMFRGMQAEPLTLPQEVISKCLLEYIPGKTIILKEFIESMDLIKTHTDKKLILQRIDYVKKFGS